MKEILPVESHHNLSPTDVAAVEEGLYNYNREITGRHDGEGLAFVARDDKQRIIGAAAGYSWAGIAELRQMWVHESHRGHGLGGSLLTAFIDEARKRNVQRIWVASFDFQAPTMYEKFGFHRVTELAGFPEGHNNVILCKDLAAP